MVGASEGIGKGIIEIVADGSGLDDSIRKEFHTGDKAAQDAGEEHAKRYHEGFDKENQKGLDKTLGRFKTFFKKLDEDGNKITFDDRIRDGFRRVSFESGKVEASLDRFGESAKKTFREFKEDPMGSLNNGLNRTYITLGRVQDRFTRFGSSIKRDVTGGLSAAGRKIRDFGDDSERTGTRLGLLSERLDHLGDRIGNTFGKGSRNDFVNFFGAAIGGISKVAFKVVDIADSIGKFSKAFKEGEGIIGRFSAGFSAASTEGGTLLATLGEFAIAIPIVVVVVGALVSVVSLLAGVVTALASTISFALVGALGVTLGLLGPLAAGVGVLALAFGGLGSRTSAAHKQLSAFLSPITSQLKALSQVTKQHLFGGLAEDGKSFGVALGNLQPLVIGTADALNKMFGDVSRAAASDGFKKYMAQVTPIIVKMLPELGAAAGNTAKAIGGLFLGVLPSADDFLVSLDKLTAKFAKWANSAGGQNQIKKFMDDAKESAISLGHFVGQLGGLIDDLLFNAQGKKTGDSLFDSMADAIKRFRAYIADGGLEKWFKDSKKFGEDLGDVIVSIGKVLDDLDSPGFRAFAGFLLKVFVELAETIDDLIHPVVNLVQALDDLAHLDFSGFASNIGKFVGGALKSVLDVFTFGFGDEILNGLGRAKHAISGFGGFLKDTLTGDHKVKVDFSDLVSLTKYAHTTDESLRILLGLPKIKPKVDTKPLGDAITSTQLLIDHAKRFAGLPTSEVKVKKTQADAAKLSLLLMQSTYVDAKSKLGKELQIKINAAQAKLAGDAIQRVKDLLAGLRAKPDANLKVTTTYVQRGKSPAAHGGTFDEFGQRLAIGGFSGILNSQTRLSNGVTGGEAGREAVVPLDKPLGQVDPSVRWLAAIAQGKAGIGGSKIINNSPTIITPTTDPYAVAREVINELTLTGGDN